MTNELSGDIEINETSVRFSENVGRYATPEQVSLLFRVAHELGKYAVNDRYPTSQHSREFLENFHGRDQITGQPARRNEHGVPKSYITASLFRQMKELGHAD